MLMLRRPLCSRRMHVQAFMDSTGSLWQAGASPTLTLRVSFCFIALPCLRPDHHGITASVSRRGLGADLAFGSSHNGSASLAPSRSLPCGSVHLTSSKQFFEPQEEGQRQGVAAAISLSLCDAHCMSAAPAAGP